MNQKTEMLKLLKQLPEVMEKLGLWQNYPPSSECFNSIEPFSIDTMAAEEWLQWVFLPRIIALLEAEQPLPQRFNIAPYFEEAFKQLEKDPYPLLTLLRSIDALFAVGDI